MQKLSFYSFYNYYTSDYLEFATNLSRRLGGTIHVSYNNYFDTDTDYSLPEKHFINFFRSNLFYLDVNFFIENNEKKVFYTLQTSYGITRLDNLEIHFLPNGVIRVFEFEEDTDWCKFVDLLFMNSMNSRLPFTILRRPYILKFIRIFFKLGSINLYFFPKSTYDFEKYINTLFSRECLEESLLKYQHVKDKIKFYTNSSISEYLSRTLHESLLVKRKKKIAKYGIFKFILKPKSS